VRLARTAGLPLDKWRKISGPVLEMFTVEGDRIVGIGLQQELKKTTGLIEKRRHAGALGGTAKSLNKKEPDFANRNGDGVISEPRRSRLSI
jgi:uncharacterized protein YdaU (DUF1376 family)